MLTTKVSSDSVGIAIVSGSMHHLMSGLAYVEYYRESLLIMQIDILCDSHMGKTFSPSNEILKRISDDFKVKVNVREFETAIVCRQDWFPVSVEKFIYITPRRFSLKIYCYWAKLLGSGSRLEWVDSEEGIGSYSNLLVRLNSAFENSFTSFITKLLNEFSGIFFNRNFVRFLSPGQGVLRDSPYLPEIKKLYERYYLSSSWVDLDASGKDVMLFAAQPVVEAGWLSESEYRDFIVAIKIHAENQGYKFVVKPHHNEDLSKYHPELVYGQGASIEQIIINDKAIKAVATVCSSALYTAKIIRPLRAFIYTNEKMFDKFYEKPVGIFKIIKKIPDDFFIVN